MANNDEAGLPCYDRALFCERVADAKVRSGLDWDEIAQAITDAGYPISKANLKTYIFQRTASLKLVIYLSRILHVSIDYLLGNEENSITPEDGFDYNYSGHRYQQYDGDFYMYFHPTRTNEPEKPIEAKLHIDVAKGGRAMLEVPVDDGKPKIYAGHLLLSSSTNTGFLQLRCNNGESIEYIFNDPNTFQNKLHLCVGALISVSSGDSKRMPTLSRAVITDSRLTDEGLRYVKANLRLNSKYIDVSREDLERILQTFFEENAMDNFKRVYQRISNAFCERTYYSIEEQYFLNTFKTENKLNDKQTETLIADLRNNSLSSINCKIPRAIDVRLYLLLRDGKMFIDET